MSGLKRRGAVAGGVAIFTAFSFSAVAGEEILTRNSSSFHECPSAISKMLNHLGANNNNVQTIMDTGAHYYVELSSVEANLQFRCNAVTEQLEIARVTPGTLQLASD